MPVVINDYLTHGTHELDEKRVVGETFLDKDGYIFMVDESVTRAHFGKSYNVQSEDYHHADKMGEGDLIELLKGSVKFVSN